MGGGGLLVDGEDSLSKSYLVVEFCLTFEG